MPKKHRSPHSPASASSHTSRHLPRASRKRNLLALWIGIGLVMVFGAALLLLRPSSATPTEITAAQAFEKHQTGALFVDVRSQEEWNQGHIAKSILIPLDELPNRLNELPNDRDIVVVCHTGVRAKQGATILREAGFPRVSCMTGGLQAWVDAGYPTEQQ